MWMSIYQKASLTRNTSRSLRAGSLFLMDVVKPQLVFYQAGVDISEHDRLGKLKITRKGLRRRNELVYRAVQKRGIPLVLTMSGGYPKNLDTAFKTLSGAQRLLPP